MSRVDNSLGRAMRRISRLAILGIGGFAVGSALTTSPTAAAGTAGFGAPVFVDTVRAGGEPGILHSNKYGNLVYTSHEGTTHIDRSGGPASIQQFLCPGLTTADCYKNHVWIWTSDDHGKTWQLRDEALPYTGFSDPDLTQDASGSIYNTGIDLANDSVFSSQDGGKTWPHGTTNCHEADRPWLAGGGAAGEVYMATDTEENGHEVFYSANYADSCSVTGIADNGSFNNGQESYSGFGKLVYDAFDGSLIEPAVFTHTDGTIGVGISRLPNARDAFNGGHETWQPQEVVYPTTVYSPFGAPELISMDSAENIYFAWDTNERDPNGTGGCSQLVPNTGGGPTPLPNRIMFVAGTHVGLGAWTFSAPVSLASQGNARVLWPWSVAGSAGNVSVVWYQMDKMVDPDCDIYNGQTVPDVKTYVYQAQISNATNPSKRRIAVVNASGRYIHQGGICDSGTTCVATGQDRRLGDYFTNSVDSSGCVVIASGDTTVPDPISGGPRATSLPIFIRQISGASLTTGKSCG
ncbi:MAG: exo-alpha-sialidase [Chloroflexi bacterium]|nr:MAG: exo-alpha-sialidase [Chloroflexota bacterium]